MLSFKPCPFCGESFELVIVPTDIYYFVACACCHAFGPHHATKAGAVAKWNDRPLEGLPVSIQEALNSGDGTYRP